MERDETRCVPLQVCAGCGLFATVAVAVASKQLFLPVWSDLIVSGRGGRRGKVSPPAFLRGRLVLLQLVLLVYSDNLDDHSWTNLGPFLPEVEFE